MHTPEQQAKGADRHDLDHVKKDQKQPQDPKPSKKSEDQCPEEFVLTVKKSGLTQQQQACRMPNSYKIGTGFDK